MNKMTEKINVGVIGCGYWGPNLIRNFLNNKGCGQLQACDVDESKLARTQSRYPNITLTSDCDGLLSSTDIDAVAIATPVNTHFSIAQSALQNGKHVFVEKPFTFSSSEANQLIELAEEKGLTLMVGHSFEYPSFVSPVSPRSTFTKRAPRDFTCSSTAGRVSKASTRAPRRRAVAMA